MKSFVIAFLAAVLLSACSSVSVKNFQRGGGGGGMARPKQVYVVPFDTGGATIRIAGTKTAAESDAFKQNLATVLADYTVKNVSKHVAPAVKIASAAAAPATGWLVTGRFIRVNTGSRGLRVFVGLGAGGTKMETAVEVIDLAGNRHRPILQFTTTGGSNAMPGLLSSTGPGSAAFSMMTQANTGVTDDAARTSRMITGALSEYFVERGWIAQGQVFKTKKPGDYQLIHGM